MQRKDNKLYLEFMDRELRFLATTTLYWARVNTVETVLSRQGVSRFNRLLLFSREVQKLRM